MISIIIPTLNEARWIGDTLEKFKELTEHEHEIIVSDGKSTDDTVAIARRYTPHIISYEGATRQTIGQAKNMGAAIAKGEYLLFMDADVTVADPNAFFTKALWFFKMHPKVLGLTVYLRVHPDYETFVDRVAFAIITLLYIIQNNILNIGASNGEFQFVRADAFRKIGGFNEKLVVAEDMDLFQRIARIGRTRIYLSLTAFHSGRRAHAIGWARLTAIQLGNFFSNMLVGKSISKEWVPIREHPPVRHGGPGHRHLAVATAVTGLVASCMVIANFLTLDYQKTDSIALSSHHLATKVYATLFADTDGSY